MGDLVKPLHHDPFEPILYNSEALTITEEQRQYMWEVLQTGASDSRFAQKMYNACIVILTAGSTPVPEVTSLNPNTVALGSESFDIHVMGKNFDEQSHIVWNGAIEPTTRVSDSELTTQVNMGTAVNAVSVPVQVQSSKGVLSNSMLFEFTPAAPATTSVLKQQNESQQVRNEVMVGAKK